MKRWSDEINEVIIHHSHRFIALIANKYVRH